MLAFRKEVTEGEGAGLSDNGSSKPRFCEERAIE